MNLLRRQIRYGEGGDPWEALANHVIGLPDGERERLRRLGMQQGARIDSSHPPTQLRIDLIQRTPVRTARVVMDAGRAAGIDRELAPAYKVVAGRLAVDLGA